MDLFGTAGIRGPVADTVTPALALRVGRAAGVEGEEFVIGRDGRTSGEGLTDALAAGVLSVGAPVRRLGVVPTPALAFASRGRRGAMVTASHNPPSDNGIKLFADGVEYDREQESALEERLDAGVESADWNDWGRGESASALPAYRRAVADYAADHGADPDGLAVAVDCGTGTAALATPAVLTDLGARVHALNATVDGRFPARDSKPTVASLSDLRADVAEADVAVGFGHDGDGDRIVVVDADGAVIHEDTVLAVLAHQYVSRSEVADPVVVTTPNASGRIDQRVSAAGGRVERVRLGALHEGIAHVRATAGPETRVVFAAEPWKHLHPDFGGWIDAIASAAVLTRLVAAQGLETLLEPVAERPYRKVSVTCPDARKDAAMRELESTLPEAYPGASVDRRHGLRLDRPGGGWLLVRPSGTEPKLRIYAESDDVGTLVTDVRALVDSAIEP
jgi:phosphomannomutase